MVRPNLAGLVGLAVARPVDLVFVAQPKGVLLHPPGTIVRDPSNPVRGPPQKSAEGRQELRARKPT